MLDWLDSDNEVKETEESLLEVENKYNIKFPHSYREMLKLHSGEQSEELEEMIELQNIISMDEYPEYECLSHMDKSALKKVFPIFQSLSGDFYAFDYNVLNNNNEPTIIDIDHESYVDDELVRYDSFDEFIIFD